MDTDPRIVWRDGQPMLLDLFALPHSAADLRAAIARLEAQAAAAGDPAGLYAGAIADRQAWLQALTAATREAIHVA
jgi:hypothetical protein